jgi:antitoxin (DNA-binding transcriptional repressor) of toxin-antitoxin stability system
MTKTTSITELPPTAQAMVDEAVQNNEALVVTKNGIPIMRIVPLAPARENRDRDSLRGSVKILGDIVDPIDRPR